MTERGGRLNRPLVQHRGLAVLAAWTLVAMLLAGQAWFAAHVRGEPLTLGRASLIWLTWAATWAALTPVALRLVAKFPLVRPRLLLSLAVHAIASPVFALASLALFALAAPLVGATHSEPTWLATLGRLLGTTFLLNLPVYWLIVGAAQLERLVRTARENERRQLMLEAQLADARLQALRTQLQPHFLFNALNTISVLMREDVDSADRMLLQLSTLLRRSLDGGEAYEVLLGEEIAFLRNYLEIEQVRFGERLSYEILVPGELMEARVPNLILQPLVENALRHGLAGQARPGWIQISASRQGEQLRLLVRDDGRGLSPGLTERIGLSNTRARLSLMYPGKYRFELLDVPGGGVTAEIVLPLRIGP